MNSCVAPRRIGRDQPSGLMVLCMSCGVVVAAFLVAGLLMWGYGISPLRFYSIILQNNLADPRGLADVERKAIPLLFTGIGLVVAFRAQFWNIGAEGQLLAGAVAAAGVALFSGLPAPWLLPLMFIAGGLAGALWGLLPTVLKVRLQVNEVITTLMMNYIALYFVQWLIHGPWKGKSMLGFAYTDTFPDAAWHPLKAIAGALFFGALYHLSFRLQVWVAAELLKLLPYVCTIAALTVVTWGKTRSGTAPQRPWGVPISAARPDPKHPAVRGGTHALAAQPHCLCHYSARHNPGRIRPTHAESRFYLCRTDW